MLVQCFDMRTIKMMDDMEESEEVKDEVEKGEEKMDKFT